MPQIIVGKDFGFSHPHSILSVENNTVVDEAVYTPPATGTVLLPFFAKKGTGNKIVELTGIDRVKKAKQMFGEPDELYDPHYAFLIEHLMAGGDAYASRLVTTNQIESSNVVSAEIVNVPIVEDIAFGYALEMGGVSRYYEGAAPATGDPVVIGIKANELEQLKFSYAVNALDTVNRGEIEAFISGDGDVNALVGNNKYYKTDEITDNEAPIAVAIYHGRGDYGKHMSYTLNGIGDKLDDIHPIYRLAFYDDNAKLNMGTVTGVIDKYSVSTLPKSIETLALQDRDLEFTFNFVKPGLDKMAKLVLNYLKTTVLNTFVAGLKTQFTGVVAEDIRIMFTAPLNTLIDNVEKYGLSALNLAGGSVTGIDWLDKFLDFDEFVKADFQVHPDNIPDIEFPKVLELDDGIRLDTTEGPYSITETPAVLIANFFSGATPDSDISGRLEDRLVTPIDYIIDPVGYTHDIVLAIKGLCEQRMDIFALVNAPTYISEVSDMLDWGRMETSNSRKIFKFGQNGINSKGLTTTIPKAMSNNVLKLYIDKKNEGISGVTNGTVTGLKDIKPKLIFNEDKSTAWNSRCNYISYSKRYGFFVDGDVADVIGQTDLLLELHNQIILGKAIKKLHSYLDTKRHKIHTDDTFAQLTKECNELLEFADGQMTFKAYYATPEDSSRSKVTDEITWKPVGKDRFHKFQVNIISSLTS